MAYVNSKVVEYSSVNIFHVKQTSDALLGNNNASIEIVSHAIRALLGDRDKGLKRFLGTFWHLSRRRISCPSENDVIRRCGSACAVALFPTISRY